MCYGKFFFLCFASLRIFCCISFSPIKQLDVSTPVVQEETVDSPAPSNVSGRTDGMEVSTETMTRQHTSQILTDLLPEGQGTAVFGVKSFFCLLYFPRKKDSIIISSSTDRSQSSSSIIVFKIQIANKEI